MTSDQAPKARDQRFGLKVLLAAVLVACVISTLFTSLYFASLVCPGVFPPTVSYTIETNGVGNYWATRYDGKRFWEGRDASLTINSAISSGQRVSLRDGTFELHDYLSLKHGTILEGVGENTVIKQAPGANLDYLIYIHLKDDASFGRVQLRNFVLDGNKARQTGGNGYGVYSETYSSVLSDLVLFRDLYVRNAYGIGIETYGNYYLFENVYVYNASSHGFVIKDYHARLESTVARKNGGDGYVLCGTGLHSLIGVRSLQNHGNGIRFCGVDSNDLRSEMIGGSVMMNGQHGILFEGASYNRVIGVSVEGNSYTEANSSDNVHFKSYGAKHSRNNILEGNILSVGIGQIKYQIYEADSNQDYNLVQGNQILGDGQAGKILLQGSSSEEENNISSTT